MRARTTAPDHRGMLITDRPSADVEALRARLHGEVFGPDDAGYDEHRKPWNRAVDQRPAAVAFPRTDEDVVTLVESRPQPWPRARAPGHGPRRGRDRHARAHDPRLHQAHARRPDRPDDAHRPRPRGQRVERRHRPRRPVRPRPAGGQRAGRRHRRLHARRRPGLARPRARLGVQQRHGDRARDRRRPAHPHRHPHRAGAVLGPARRRQQRTASSPRSSSSSTR